MILKLATTVTVTARGSIFLSGWTAMTLSSVLATRTHCLDTAYIWCSIQTVVMHAQELNFEMTELSGRQMMF
jgi:hypothetical protein